MRDPREVYNIPTTATNHQPNTWSPSDPRHAYADPHQDNDGEAPWLPRNLQRSIIQHWISTTAVVVSQRPTPRQLKPGKNLGVGRRAYLWVRWDRLTRLETLFLDLRGYSTEPRTVHGSDLAKIAGMLHGMRLKLLVVAGLRSWGLFPGFDPTTMRDVETGGESQIPWLWMNEGFGGDLNVFKTFRERSGRVGSLCWWIRAGGRSGWTR